MQVYLEYEQSLNYEIKDTHDWQQKAYWHTLLFPKVGLYMVDARLQRSLHRHQMKDMDWTDHEYIGPGQMEDFKVRVCTCHMLRGGMSCMFTARHTVATTSRGICLIVRRF